MASNEFDPTIRPQVAIPKLCDFHLRDAVHFRLKLKEWEPWRANLIVLNILLFQAISGDERIWKRAEGKTENLGLVLGEIGCLACWSHLAYRRVIRVLKKGLDHAAAVSKGEIIDDPDFPYWKNKDETDQ